MGLQENSIELVGWYGGDLTHCLSAWTSISRDLTPAKKARIGKLLKQLAKGSDGNSHGTPFEKSFLHFLVDSEIASHIHLLKHRIGVSINAESARYKELKEDKYYLPTDWPDVEKMMLQQHCEDCFEMYHGCVENLTEVHGFDKKRAKESARFYLPYAASLTCDISFNFRSFVHFQKLRNADGAQVEIREIAKEMLKLVRETKAFDKSLEAFGL